MGTGSPFAFVGALCKMANKGKVMRLFHELTYIYSFQDFTS